MAGRARERLTRLCVCAMMVAAAAVLDMFSFDFFIGGGAAKHINFGGAFLAYAAYIGGPVYGAAAYGVKDIVAWLMKPNGAYNPLFTLVALFKGACVGFMWHAAKRAAFEKAGFAAACASLAVAAAGLVNQLVISYMPGSGYALLILRLGKDANLLAAGLMLAGLIGTLNSLAFYMLRGKMKEAADIYSRCLFATIAPGLAATAVNTVVLKFSYLQSTPFAALLIPRLAAALLFILLDAYILAAIMAAIKRSGLKI